MTKTIIFDFFGVICNQPYYEWLKAYNTRDYDYGHLVSLQNLIEKGELSIDEFYQQVGEHTQKNPTKVELEILDSVVINRELVGVIAKLSRKYQLAVLANANADILKAIMSAHKLDWLFNSVIASSSLRMLKPNIEIFQHALATLNTIPNSTIFVDDTLTNIQSAKHLAIHSILFENNQDLIEQFTSLGLFEP